MTSNAKGIIACRNWQELSVDTVDGAAKITRITAENFYSGDLEGQSKLEYIMYYADAATGRFVALEHVTGRFGAKSGQFVLQHIGTFAQGVSETALTVLPGSASGDLSGLTATGKSIWNKLSGHTSFYVFEYTLG